MEFDEIGSFLTNLTGTLDLIKQTVYENNNFTHTHSIKLLLIYNFLPPSSQLERAVFLINESKEIH